MFHWNDKEYEGNDCPKCGEYQTAKTVKELEQKIAQHKC